MRSPGSIARLKVTHDDVAPAVMRRLGVPFDLRLDRLHGALQAVLGWTDTHLWEFRARGVDWGIPDPEWDRGSGPLDGRKATLEKMSEDTGAKTLNYLYDFGDGCAVSTSTCRSFATISSGLCRFLDIDPSSTWPKAIPQGGPLLRGQTTSCGACSRDYLE